MTLPAGHARHLVDRCALGLTQHGNHHVLLRRALWVASRLRIGQGLDCRPQLLDQPLAVANLSPLIDTGQRVPQCQKPLAAERRRVQSFLRRDDNLALADCGRRLAAQRDAVIADDVGAHGGFSWLVRRPAAASRPLPLSSPPKATLLWISCGVVALPPSIRLLASELRASSPDQSVHSRFLVLSRHAFMPPVLLNVTRSRRFRVSGRTSQKGWKRSVKVVDRRCNSSYRPRSSLR